MRRILPFAPANKIIADRHIIVSDNNLPSLNFLLVSSIVLTFVPVEFKTGLPQLGQVSAISETSLLQSGHLIKDIYLVCIYDLFIYFCVLFLTIPVA